MDGLRARALSHRHAMGYSPDQDAGAKIRAVSPQETRSSPMAGLAALAAAYVMSQFYRSFLAVLTPALTAELGMTKGDLALASGAWFTAFALMQFVVGVSLDRFGPRRTASVLLAAGAGGGALIFAAAQAPWAILVAMTLIGIGCAPVLMASVYIFAQTQPPARLAVLISWLVGFGTAGNVVGASPMAAAAEAMGWRPIMAALGLLTLAVAAGIAAFVRDPARPEGSASAGLGFSGYLDLLKIRALWPILPLVMVNYAAPGGIRGLWAGPYLADVYGADVIAIGYGTLAMALAMVAGSFAYGPMDQIFGTRKWVAFAGNFIGVVALSVLALAPAPGFVASAALLAAVGLFGGSFGLMMTHGRAFIPPHLTGRGVTLLNFFSIGTTGIVQFATGPIVAASTRPGQPEAAYATLFGFYAALLAAALAVYLFARDAKPETR